MCFGLYTSVGQREKSVREADRERDRQIVAALMCAPSSVIRKGGEEKGKHYRANASLQTTSLEECVWLLRQVEASHTRSCVQMSIATGDDVQEPPPPRRPQARLRSDAPVRKSKTAWHPNSTGFSFATLFLSYGLLISCVFERVSLRYISLQPDVYCLLWEGGFCTFNFKKWTQNPIGINN